MSVVSKPDNWPAMVNMFVNWTGGTMVRQEVLDSGGDSVQPGWNHPPQDPAPPSPPLCLPPHSSSNEKGILTCTPLFSAIPQSYWDIPEHTHVHKHTQAFTCIPAHTRLHNRSPLLIPKLQSSCSLPTTTHSHICAYTPSQPPHHPNTHTSPPNSLPTHISSSPGKRDSCGPGWRLKK